MAKEWPCKIGTIPALVVIKSGKRPKRVGQRIDVRDATPGSKWFRVRIIQPPLRHDKGYGDHFFAERM